MLSPEHQTNTRCAGIGIAADSDYSDSPDVSDAPPRHGASLPASVSLAILESELLSIAAFQSLQNEVTASVRTSVVDWLTRVTLRIPFQLSTLFNAVRTLDVVFSRVTIPRASVHLVSATCLWMAAKVEEMALAHSLSGVLIICHGQFEAESFRNEELRILEILNGPLDFSTVIIFVAPLLAFADAPGAEADARFWALLTLYEHSVIEVPSPVAAVAAIAAAMGPSCPLEKLRSAVPRARRSVIVSIVQKIIVVALATLRKDSNAIRDRYSTEVITSLVGVAEAGVQRFRSKK
jgi:hypothetical protein